MNRKISMFVMTFVMVCIFLVGCRSYEDEYAKAEEITLLPAQWEEESSIFGIENIKEKGGVLLTNTSSYHAEVLVKATYYDEKDNYLDEDTKSVTLKAKESWFVNFEIDEDVVDVKYAISTNKAYEEPASASDLELDYEDNEIIVRNNSEKDTEECAIQFVFYNIDGEILYVDEIEINEGFVPAGEKVAEPYEIEYPSYLEEYNEFEICIKCLLE